MYIVICKSRLEEEYWGEKMAFKKNPGEDPNYWPEDKLLILKGDMTCPKPVEIVKKWEIE